MDYTNHEKAKSRKGEIMKGFQFGLEAEYILTDQNDFKALSWKDLNFKKLYQAMEKIPIEDLPSLEGLDPEDAHTKILPYVVEGYHIKDKNNQSVDMWPKGVEIRTPVCQSIEQTLSCFQTLYQRLENTMAGLDYQLISLSHHPNEYFFEGPRCNRRYDFWKWALEVMTTYGPDINISFPDTIAEKLFQNKEDFEAKVNYYAPALTALTLNSPFKEGRPQQFHGKDVLSWRTFRRSTIAPNIEWHWNENGRIEFKFFEMTNKIDDFHAYFLMCLGLSLCDELQGRALKQECIYEMGEVACYGLKAQFVQNKLSEFFPKVNSTLQEFGFPTEVLTIMQNRKKTQHTPAESLLGFFYQNYPLSYLKETNKGLIIQETKQSQGVYYG
jgi:hypothetical protein